MLDNKIWPKWYKFAGFFLLEFLYQVTKHLFYHIFYDKKFSIHIKLEFYFSLQVIEKYCFGLKFWQGINILGKQDKKWYLMDKSSDSRKSEEHLRK